MYIYQGHLGSLYGSEEPLDDDSLYCEQCGDSDWLMGCFDTAEDFLRRTADDIWVPDASSGGWDLDYVLEVLNALFDDVPTRAKAEELVLLSRTNKNNEEEFQ